MLKGIKVSTVVVWVMTLESCQNFEAFCLHRIDAACTVKTKTVRSGVWNIIHIEEVAVYGGRILLSVSVSILARPRALISVIALPRHYKQRRANELTLDVLILSCPLNSECTDFNLKRFAACGR
jgi:hypothetical protein